MGTDAGIARADGGGLDLNQPIGTLTDDEWRLFCQQLAAMHGDASVHYWCTGTGPSATPCTGCPELDWSADGCYNGARLGWLAAPHDCTWTAGQQLACLHALDDGSCDALSYTTMWLPPHSDLCGGAVECWGAFDGGI